LGLGEFTAVLDVLSSFRRGVREARLTRRRHRMLLRNANILLLMLLNGLRAKEAIECYRRWLGDPERFVVLVESREVRSGVRLCVVPFKPADSIYAEGLKMPTPAGLSSFARQVLGVDLSRLSRLRRVAGL